VTAKPKSAALWDQYWREPDDDVLRIYADALEQEGDPRGRFIQLSLADKQDEAGVWERKHGGNLVGAAKMFLRQWRFADNGTVESARTELPNLVNGLELINRVSPRLILELTSVRTLAHARAFGKLSPSSLGKIYMLDFGCAITDSQLAAMAPAFGELRHLSLTCRGKPKACFTPNGLHALGTRATKLRLLWIEHRQYGGLPVAEFARAIAESFPALEALEFSQATKRDLGTRKIELNKIVNRSDRAMKISKLLD
jgi:uncharacterized protein (TIGR02996 family)